MRTSAAGRRRTPSSSTRTTAWSRRFRRQRARSREPTFPGAGGRVMTTTTVPAGSARKRRSGGTRSLSGPSSLGLGVAVLWFSLLVLIPLALVVTTALSGGIRGFIDTITSPQTLSAVELTVVQAFLVTLLNIVMGTVIAWVLVRDRFWGKRILDVIIDIPFAMPTIVAGLVLLALYGP